MLRRLPSSKQEMICMIMNVMLIMIGKGLRYSCVTNDHLLKSQSIPFHSHAVHILQKF